MLCPEFTRTTVRSHIDAGVELVTDPRVADRGSRSRNAPELIAQLDAAFVARNNHEWRALFMRNGPVFEAVAKMDEIAHDKQMLDTEVLPPFEGDSLLTVNSPFFVTGSRKVTPRCPEIEKNGPRFSS